MKVCVWEGGGKREAAVTCADLWGEGRWTGVGAGPPPKQRMRERERESKKNHSNKIASPSRPRALS